MFVDVINLLIAAHVVLVDKYTVYSVDFSMAKTLNPRVVKPEGGLDQKVWIVAWLCFDL